MTLVLAVHCKDGLVLASDSQATFATSGQPVKHTMEKLFCPWSNVAWSSSGTVGIIQHIEARLHKDFAHSNSFSNKTAAAARGEFVKSVAEEIRQLHQHQIIDLRTYPRPDTAFLFVGYFKDGPMILEILPNLVDQDHISTGYAAIGSGDIFPYFALAGLAHFDVAKRGLDEAKWIAHRIVQDAINAAAQFLGPPVQMAEVVKPTQQNQPGAARKLSRDEVNIIEDKVKEWKTLESDTLTAFLGTTQAAAQAPAAVPPAAVPPAAVPPADEPEATKPP